MYIYKGRQRLWDAAKHSNSADGCARASSNIACITNRIVQRMAYLIANHFRFGRKNYGPSHLSPKYYRQ